MFNLTTAPMANNSNHVQTRKEVNKVYKTNDLSIFKQIDGNRVPNLQHVKRLADSIRVYGMKCNPILVNERMEVIDGQHRLMAAKEAESFVYYIIVDGYALNEVHTLNLNQKNWSKKDFMDGYANMGVESYIKLRDFVNKNDDYVFSDCIALCQNTGSGSSRSLAVQTSAGVKLGLNAQIFEQGTWRCGDIDIAQDMANKIRMIKPYYSNYNRSSFVQTMMGLLQKETFDFNDFMHKIRLQPTAMVDCANREQYKTLIEDIYNYKSRNKVSLRY
jgi:3-isopropylmalate dehydratase small subunit